MHFDIYTDPCIYPYISVYIHDSFFLYVGTYPLVIPDIYPFILSTCYPLQYGHLISIWISIYINVYPNNPMLSTLIPQYPLFSKIIEIGIQKDIHMDIHTHD